MTQNTHLQTAYDAALSTHGLNADSLVLIENRSEVELRAAALQTKLDALGVNDITQEGSLVLAGTIELTPGLTRGSPSLSSIPFDASAALDLDTFPELFEYTHAGRAAVPRRLDNAVQVGRAAARAPGRPRTPTRAGTPTTHAGTPTTHTGTQTPAGTPTPAGTLNVGTAMTHVFSTGGGRTLMSAGSPVLAADEFLLVADTLQIQAGTDIVIASHVNYLTILAREITVGAGARIVWEPIETPERGAMQPDGSDGRSFDPFIENDFSAFTSPSGGDGGPGHGGNVGLTGERAPELEIWALEIDRLPALELQGWVGGKGQTGAAGGDGGDGCKGAHSKAVVFCTDGPGWGGDGGDGGEGGRGGRGGPGGRGGNVTFLTTDACHEATLETGFTINIAGGPGGPGGDGGQGGSGGRGGEEGDNAFPCSAAPEREGSDGRDGDDGDTGPQGTQGPTGLFSAVVITEAEFTTKWTAPQIRTVTPLSVAIGDTVTIEGANFVAGASATFDGTPAVTTFIADTILQAEVPAVRAGEVDVLVTIPGGAVSNPAGVHVTPTLTSITPSPTVLGATLTITGSGFDSGSKVLFRGDELSAFNVAADGSSLQVTLPRPTGPFEDLGGTETISVRGLDWTATVAGELVLRHVLSTGFDVTRNAYSFTNSLPSIAGVANLGTFEQTYGAFEVASEFLLEPVLTGAWFGFYLVFFNNMKPGYSTGFSSTAADEYWKGNPNLFTDHTALSQVEPLLTVAQGHILSAELLDELAFQANTPGREELTLNEVEDVFRDQLTATAEAARRMAPVMQLMPAGSILSPGFLSGLSVSHGLLPIRIEFPAPGETFFRRLAVYDNALPLGAGSESVAEYTGSPGSLSFTLFPVDAFGEPVRTSPDPRSTSGGFTLSHVSLEDCLLTDVSLPRDFVFLLVPGPDMPPSPLLRAKDASVPSLVIADAKGRRLGSDGRQTWGDLPDALPAIGAPGLYLLPLDRDLRFAIHAEEAATYTLGIVSRSLGTSVTLAEVPIAAGGRDTIEIADSLHTVTVSTGEAQKELALHYGVEGVGLARALELDGVHVGRTSPLTLRADRDLATFQLEAPGQAQKVAVALSAASGDDVQRRKVGSVEVGGGHTRGFALDWEPLALRSLGEKPAPQPVPAPSRGR